MDGRRGRAAVHFGAGFRGRLAGPVGSSRGDNRPRIDPETEDVGQSSGEIHLTLREFTQFRNENDTRGMPPVRFVPTPLFGASGNVLLGGAKTITSYERAKFSQWYGRHPS